MNRRSAPPILPTYKNDHSANLKTKIAGLGGGLSSGKNSTKGNNVIAVAWVIIPTLLIALFFVSIYAGTYYLQEQIEAEERQGGELALMGGMKGVGLPGTRNEIRKWSIAHLHGVDITNLGPPPATNTTRPHSSIQYGNDAVENSNSDHTSGSNNRSSSMHSLQRLRRGAHSLSPIIFNTSNVLVTKGNAIHGNLVGDTGWDYNKFNFKNMSLSYKRFSFSNVSIIGYDKLNFKNWTDAAVVMGKSAGSSTSALLDYLHAAASNVTNAAAAKSGALFSWGSITSSTSTNAHVDIGDMQSDPVGIGGGGTGVSSASNTSYKEASNFLS